MRKRLRYIFDKIGLPLHLPNKELGWQSESESESMSYKFLKSSTVEFHLKSPGRREISFQLAMDLNGQGMELEAAWGRSRSNRLESEAQNSSSSSSAIEEGIGDVVIDSVMESYLLGINDSNQNTIRTSVHQDEAEVGVGSRRNAAASRTVVQNLPSVVLSLSEEDDSILCSICTDRIKVGEETKQLPCGHGFHGDCISPWLSITNTCPLCRHQLPTQS